MVARAVQIQQLNLILQAVAEEEQARSAAMPTALLEHRALAETDYLRLFRALLQPMQAEAEAAEMLLLA